MPITYQQESLVTCMSQIEALAKLEWEEVQHCKESKPFCPDWELYMLLEDKGYLMVFTARELEKIIGYFCVTISPSLHSKGEFIVTNDAIFLHPDHRKSRVGVNLFKFTEKCLAESGYNFLYVSTTEQNNIDKLMLRMGYEKVETRFLKRIGEKDAN